MVQNFAAVGTLIIGLAVVLIAYCQFRVAHNKLRLDLFDRRYRTYEAARKFLLKIGHGATFEFSDLVDFNLGTSDVDFLFDKDVAEYLQEIRTRAVDMDLQRKLYDSLPIGEKRTSLVEKEHQQLFWLQNQVFTGGLTKVFAPYLSYANIKGNSLEEFFDKLKEN
jgi:hypothetical protein